MKFDIKNLCIWKEDSLSLQKMTRNQAREIRDGDIVYPFYMANQFVDVDIADLNLTVRSYNCLKRMGWNLVGDIVKSIDTKQDLLRVRNLGKTSAEEIFQTLIDYHQELLESGEKSVYRKLYNALNGIGINEQKESRDKTVTFQNYKEKIMELTLEGNREYIVQFLGLME